MYDCMHGNVQSLALTMIEGCLFKYEYCGSSENVSRRGRAFSSLEVREDNKKCLGSSCG